MLSLSAAVISAGYTWPWRKEGELGPRLFVLAAGLLLGALTATAAHDSISGPWPAFIFGIGAPATIRGILSGVEVEPRRAAGTPRAPRQARVRPLQPGRQEARHQEEGEVREGTP